MLCMVCMSVSHARVTDVSHDSFTLNYKPSASVQVLACHGMGPGAMGTCSASSLRLPSAVTDPSHDRRSSGFRATKRVPMYDVRYIVMHVLQRLRAEHRAATIST